MVFLNLFLVLFIYDSQFFNIFLINAVILNEILEQAIFILKAIQIKLVYTKKSNYITQFCSYKSPLEFFFQEQSYSSLHSGWSLAWDHVRGDIDDPCGAIADFCGVIADPAELSRSLRQSAAARSPMRRRRSLRDSLNIIKHC